MKNIHTLLALLGIAFLIVIGCSKNDTISGEQKTTDAISASEQYMLEENQNLPDFSSPIVEDSTVKVENLPEEVTWLTSHPKPLGSKHAKQGGTFQTYMTAFPLTFRSVGPDANGSTRGYFLDAVNLSLVQTNQETQEYMPNLASHWAYSSDKQTVYFKLYDNVAWTDGEPITSDDFLFAFEYMTSPNIKSSWYNEYYKNLKVTIYDDHVFSITWLPSNSLDPRDLLNSVEFSPRPRHFYAEDGGKIPENWVEKYNWKIEPVAGPYVVTNTEKGSYIELERVRPWWGDSLPQYKNFANVDKIHVKVVTGGSDIAREMFYKGELDTFSVNIPSEWRDTASNEVVVNGYVDRWVAKYSTLQGLLGLFFNTKDPLFSNKTVRKAMYYAIDIQGMIDTILFGEYKRQHTLGVGQTQYGIEFNDKSIKKPDFNPDQAKKLLAEAGFDTIGSDGIAVNKNGERVSFEISYSYKHHTERLSYIVEQAKKAGVEIELKLQAGDAFWQEFTGRRYHAAWTGYTSSYVPEYYQYVHSDQVNAPPPNNAVFNWTSPRTDELTWEIKTGDMSYEEKAVANKEIERIFDDEALFIPAFYLDFERVVAWKYIRSPGWVNLRYGMHPAYFMDEFSYIWIDEDIKKEVEQAMQENKTFEPRIWALSERYAQ